MAVKSSASCRRVWSWRGRSVTPSSTQGCTEPSTWSNIAGARSGDSNSSTSSWTRSAGMVIGRTRVSPTALLARHLRPEVLDEYSARRIHRLCGGMPLVLRLLADHLAQHIQRTLGDALDQIDQHRLIRTHLPRSRLQRRDRLRLRRTLTGRHRPQPRYPRGRSPDRRVRPQRPVSVPRPPGRPSRSSRRGC